MDEIHKNKFKGNKYNIPKTGSLGLLAMGDIGLKSWREKRGELKVVKTEDNQRLRTKGRKT